MERQETNLSAGKSLGRWSLGDHLQMALHRIELLIHGMDTERPRWLAPLYVVEESSRIGVVR